MTLNNHYHRVSKNPLFAAYTGICFLLVLKIMRAFAVKRPISDKIGAAQN